MTFEHDDSNESGVNIKVIGVGGGGNNAVNRMITDKIIGVDFVAVNTDRQALNKSEAGTKLVIGSKITHGFGCGANPEMGERAAEESLEDIKKMLEGTDMAFVIAGMGGGTGTGAAPVIARVAHEMDILTIGVVTKPFEFELQKRMRQAEAGIAELSQYVDSLVVIPNERLKEVTDTCITMFKAFETADSVLRDGVKSISDLINGFGFINLDFADVTSVMKNAGYAHMGVGSGTGSDKAEVAARQAISSPLLETSIKGAHGILMSMTISPDVSLEDATLASKMIASEASEDANVIWGVSFDPDLEDEMKITIIATGFDKKPEERVATKKPAATVVSTPAPEVRTIPVVKPVTVTVEPKVEEKPAPEPEPVPVKEEKKEPVEDTDFDDLLGDFFKPRTRK